jgi:pyruvate,water dikinase
MSRTDSIKIFQEISKNDASIAGGKGASLGEMTQAGFPVPLGFVMLSSTFERFLDETNTRQGIEKNLVHIDVDTRYSIRCASDAIRNLIVQTEIPEEISEEIQKAFFELGCKYVAVRSSATAEDGMENSWAGQLDSFLNTTEEAFLENVKRCWASLFTPRAIEYRIEKNFKESYISVAVVVQKMIESESSGIAFSVHPVTENSNQLIIEAGFGLGEAIVSGSITPDSYVVEKNSRNIVYKNIVEQTRGVFRQNGGGNEWRDIPTEKGCRQVLSDEEILELSDLVVRIENHYGFPCDIEWARAGGRLYIVQSRPITTLEKRL